MDFDQQLKQLKEANAKLLERLKNNQAQFHSQRNGYSTAVSTDKEQTTATAKPAVTRRDNNQTASSTVLYSEEKQPQSEANGKAYSNPSDEVVVTQCGKTEAARRQLASMNLSGGDDKFGFRDELNSSVNEEFQATKLSKDSVLNTSAAKLSSDRGQETVRVRTPVRFSTREDTHGRRERSMNLTSTPTKSLQADGQETPKSILKHRKIIEDNIHVKSEFNDTPLKPRKSNGSGLNFSYSNVDDLELETLLPSYAKPKTDKINYFESKSSQSSKRTDTAAKKSPTYQKATNGSYLEDMPHNSSNSRSKSDFVEMPAENQSGLQTKLLNDSGNDRPNAHIVRELNSRPKSFVFERENIDDDEVVKDNWQRTTSYNGTTNANNSNAHASINTSTASHSRGQSKNATSAATAPLLGYDFIAGVLDNESTILDQPEEFYESLKEFRRKNKDVCMTNLPPRFIRYT